MTLKQQKVFDIQEMIAECDNTSFTNYDGKSYPCKASITNLTSELVEGGFSSNQLLNMTVPLYVATRSGATVNMVSMFGSNPIPKPQKIIQYNGDNYRIISVKGKPDTTDAYMRVIAQGITRGI